MRITAYMFFLILSGCTLIPCEWDSDLDLVKSNPNVSELVGTYYPDDKTKERIKGFTGSSKMTLTEDNKFVFESFPEGAFDFDAYYQKNINTVNGFGKWRPYFSKGTAELSVSVDYGKPNSNDKFNFGTSYRIYKKDGQFVIFIMVGDPDECSAVRLIQK